jgi:hydrogenase maturation factor
MTPTEREALLEVGKWMDEDKGYSVGSLDNPQFKESQKRYQELFDKLEKEKDKNSSDAGHS